MQKGGLVRFFDVEYAVPAAMVKDKQKMTVRFQAAAGSEIAGIVGMRPSMFISRLELGHRLLNLVPSASEAKR